MNSYDTVQALRLQHTMVADVSKPNLERQQQRCESHTLISKLWQAGKVMDVCATSREQQRVMSLLSRDA